MDRRTRELLKRINDLKNEIRGFQGQGKTQEMKDKMEKLRDLQQQFEIMMELDESEKDEAESKVSSGKAKKIEGETGKGSTEKPTKEQVCSAFVSRIVCGLRKRDMPDEDQRVFDMMTEADEDENGESDGGFTVPQDISTDINELRRAESDLEQFVNVEPVATLSGSRVIEVDAESTPWEDVDENGEFKEVDTPTFKLIKYKVSKKGGILKTTRELLQDTAVNILAYLNKWIAKKSRATRNAAILAKLDEITDGKEINIADVDSLKDVFNVKLDAAITPTSVIVTNQYGFNYLDKLKDSDGNYIVQPDVTDKTKRLLFGAYPIHVVSNKTLKKTDVETSGTVTAEKYPLYMGDLKEAITLFDREKITVELSTEAGDLWAKDLTGIKVRDRFDVQAVDEKAVIKGVITASV